MRNGPCVRGGCSRGCVRTTTRPARGHRRHGARDGSGPAHDDDRGHRVAHRRRSAIDRWSVYVAFEPRFKVALLSVGGFYLQHSLPEVDAFNFAPRVRIPVLLLNGRFDFFYPTDSSQLPMFDAFQSPDGQKRRVVYDTGHNLPRPEMIRETLDWLDKYLDPPPE